MEDQLYDTIDNTNETRLLQLCDDDCWRLTVASRQGGVAYTAISYTWGSKQKPASIACNGISITVTRNCRAVLDTLCRLRIRDLLWIDAICINQHDVDERNAQVALMGNLFSSARETIVYLTGRDIGLTTPPEPLPAFSYNPTRESKLERRESRDFDCNEQNPAILRPEVLYNSPWFTRIWVVQEFLLSKKISMVTDGYECLVPWHIVEEAYGKWSVTDLLTNMPDLVVMRHRRSGKGKMDLIEATTSVLKVMDPHNSEQLGLEWQSLLEVLETTQHFKCQDSRDKLWAMLSFFPTPTPSLLLPDYSKRPSDVFANLTWFLLLGNLPDVLSLASLHHADPEMPSWVFDLSETRPQAQRLELYEDKSHFKAGIWNGRQRLRTERVSRSTLLIRGLVVGAVSAYLHDYWLADVKLPPHRSWVCKDRQGRERKVMTRQHQPKQGDICCILLGFKPAFISRPSGDHYKIVDSCEVSGLMEGQALIDIDRESAYDLEPPGLLQDFVMR